MTFNDQKPVCTNTGDLCVIKLLDGTFSDVQNFSYFVNQIFLLDSLFFASLFSLVKMRISAEKELCCDYRTKEKQKRNKGNSIVEKFHMKQCLKIYKSNRELKKERKQKMKIFFRYLPTKTAVELWCGSYGTMACPDFSVSSVYDVELIKYRWHMGRNEFVPHTSNLSPAGCANIRM